MAFKSNQVNGDGTTAVDVLVNPSTLEAVVFGLTAYNNSTTDDILTLLVNGTDIAKAVVPANALYTHSGKLSIMANNTLSIKANADTSINIAYLLGAVDEPSVSALVQEAVDMKPNIDTVVANMSDIQSIITNMTAVQTATNNALIAQSTANYKGDWNSTYNSSNGYALADSVTYTDGYSYVSKIAANTVEPTSKTNTNEWNFIEAVSPDELALKVDKSAVAVYVEANDDPGIANYKPGDTWWDTDDSKLYKCVTSSGDKTWLQIA